MTITIYCWQTPCRRSQSKSKWNSSAIHFPSIFNWVARIHVSRNFKKNWHKFHKVSVDFAVLVFDIQPMCVLTPSLVWKLWFYRRAPYHDGRYIIFRNLPVFFVSWMDTFNGNENVDTHCSALSDKFSGEQQDAFAIAQCTYLNCSIGKKLPLKTYLWFFCSFRCEYN